MWADFRIHKRLNLSLAAMERIYTILAEIDAVKNSCQITKDLVPQTIERLILQKELSKKP